MSTLKNKWKTLPKWIQIVIWTVLGIIGVTAMGFIFGYVLMLLWNKLMPNLFGLKEITYWQGIGLFILTRILFGSFGSNTSGSSNNKIPNKVITMDYKVPSKKDADEVDYEIWWNQEGKDAFEQFSKKEE